MQRGNERNGKRRTRGVVWHCRPLAASMPSNCIVRRHRLRSRHSAYADRTLLDDVHPLRGAGLCFPATLCWKRPAES
jgi:hypothetical protein